MKETITEEQSKAVLKALDEAIDNGPWEDSNFLRVIGKNLRQIRDKYASEMHVGKESSANEGINKGATGGLFGGKQEVYVSLYTTNGSLLPSWERVIANLPRQIISRPIYATEQDVQSLIKHKENKINEGYVAIYINQSDILTVPADKVAMDKFEKPLITIKNNAITLTNITRFVHSTGVYTLQKGRLVKNASDDE